MSKDLSPIRESAYKSDRRHFGMIGTVTLRDPSLVRAGSPLRKGKAARGGSRKWKKKTSREEAFLGCREEGHDGPAMPVHHGVQGLDILKICHPRFGNQCTGALGGWFWACLMDARFSVPRFGAAPSCKIDSQVDNTLFYLIMKPPTPILNVMH